MNWEAVGAVGEFFSKNGFSKSINKGPGVELILQLSLGRRIKFRHFISPEYGRCRRSLCSRIRNNAIEKSATQGLSRGKPE